MTLVSYFERAEPHARRTWTQLRAAMLYVRVHGKNGCMCSEPNSVPLHSVFIMVSRLMLGYFSIELFDQLFIAGDRNSYRT